MSMQLKDPLVKAYSLMCQAKEMADIYEANKGVCKYVHSTSRGHEAIQLATAFQLTPIDFVSPYYRDESLLLGLGFTPLELMWQLHAKKEDAFSGGKSYYAHASYRGADKPTIIHQSSATGMQAIPTTGIAQGISHWEKMRELGELNKVENLPAFLTAGQSAVVVCSLGDASMTEGEISEAIQVAVLKKLPIIFLVQDNNWGISVSASEARAMNAYEYAAGFKGLNRVQVDGSDFEASMQVMREVVSQVRKNRTPYLVHAQVPLLGHHTSGVRREFYRTEEDLRLHASHDPKNKLKEKLVSKGVDPTKLVQLETDAKKLIASSFDKALQASNPDINNLEELVFAPTPVTIEKGNRSPIVADKVLMVDAALFAIKEIMEDHPEALLYGQDVGKRLGGVFREAATLGEKFGDHRVFNTAIQEAYIVGSTVGLTATGLRPIVEVQFADYIFPGINQLVTEVAKSYFLTNGKFSVPMILRVPIGAYGGGGPYHSASVESFLLAVKGIKIAYPSNAADMKGLMKAAYLDPNPVIMLEHKGLYWSKVPGTENAKTKEPSRDYVLPFGKAAIVQEATDENITVGQSVVVITYGMGVYWAQSAAEQLNGQVEVVDLRTLYPLDESLLFERVKLHGKCLVLTEEQLNNSFAESLAARITKNCFSYLDQPIEVMGALNLPAVPLNVALEATMLPSAQKVKELLVQLLNA
jgi:2-oxoisovalerate dehydrogenase E1 component